VCLLHIIFKGALPAMDVVLFFQTKAPMDGMVQLTIFQSIILESFSKKKGSTKKINYSYRPKTTQRLSTDKPVAHLPNCEIENSWPACLECTPEVTISESSNQMILIINHKKAATTFTSELSKLIHYHIPLLAQWKLILFLHDILNLQGSVLSYDFTLFTENIPKVQGKNQLI
jgi:hypothetical protein